MYSEFCSFQVNKIQLHVANLGHARLCGSLARKRNYFAENLGEKCWESKVTKLKWLQRDYRVITEKTRSFFLKQLVINCTCEQIGLFLISTRGCGSHSWKLLKCPICSRIELIPNCFRTHRFPIQIVKASHTVSIYMSKSGLFVQRFVKRLIFIKQGTIKKKNEKCVRLSR